MIFAMAMSSVLPLLVIVFAGFAAIATGIFIWRSFSSLLMQSDETIVQPFHERDRLQARQRRLLRNIKDADTEMEEGRVSEEDRDKTVREYRLALRRVMQKLDAQGTSKLDEARELVGDSSETSEEVAAAKEKNDE